jgi:hypothetical protein
MRKTKINFSFQLEIFPNISRYDYSNQTTSIDAQQRQKDINPSTLNQSFFTYDIIMSALLKQFDDDANDSASDADEDTAGNNDDDDDQTR